MPAGKKALSGVRTGKGILHAHAGVIQDIAEQPVRMFLQEHSHGSVCLFQKTGDVIKVLFHFPVGSRDVLMHS